MSTLYVRGKKSIWIGFTDQFGRYHRKPLGIDTVNGKIPRDALKQKEKIDLQISNHTWGLQPTIPRITLSGLRDEFIEFIKGMRDKETIYLYKLAIRHAIAFFGDAPIAKITQQNIADFRDHLIKTISDAKASQTLRSLSPLFRWAVEQKGYIPSSPINRYNNVHLKRKQPTVYSPEELNRFVKWCFKSNHLHFLRQIQFLLLTGFRSNESCTITWDKIDFRERTLLHYDDKRNEWVPYPMDTKLVHFLKKVPREGEFVFHYRNKTSLNKIVGIAREKKIIRRELKIHSLKATYIRDLIAAGLSTAEIHKLSHHKSYQTTDYYYTTFEMDHLRKALKKSRRANNV